MDRAAQARCTSERSRPRFVRGKACVQGTLTESMTESETNLKPALRRDEIMPVGSFWLWSVLAADISRLPPSLLALLPPVRPRTLANITATLPREGKIMICRCKHLRESQGRSPVLDCPGRPYKPCTPVTEHSCDKQVIFLRSETGAPRFQTFDSSSCMHTHIHTA